MEKHEEVVTSPVVFATEELKSWVDLYREEFGIGFTNTKILVPKYQENTWIVLTDPRVTVEGIFSCAGKHFLCSTSIIKNQSVTDCFPFSNLTVRRFSAEIEIGARGERLLADELAALVVRSIILKERMLLELWYFRETGRHLDRSSWTLCNGSRCGDEKNALIPRAGWLDGAFCIFGGDLRERAQRTQPRLALL